MGAGLNWITGEPGTGKTSLVCNIIIKLLRRGLKVGMVTLEMSIDDMLQKLMSIIVDKNIRFALIGRAVANMEKVEEARDLLQKSGLFSISDQSEIQNEVQFKSWCRRKVLKEGAQILVLDYMQLLQVHDSRGMSDEQKVSKLTESLKEIASMLNVSLLVICEENQDGNIRYSRRGDFAGATHWRLLKVGDSEPKPPEYRQSFDVLSKKARFGVPNSKTHMALYGVTGRITETVGEEDEYDYNEPVEDLSPLPEEQSDFIDC
jgi:replicative DNA helicase